MKQFRVIPVSLAQANELVKDLHRHHEPMTFHTASIGALHRDDDRVIGAAILQRPCSTVQDDTVTTEVARLVTDGTANACSFLLGAAARLAWSLGYLRIQTYTMAEESGSSLRAAGWRMERLTPGNVWNRPARPRHDRHVIGPRIRWAAFAPEIFSQCAFDSTAPAYTLGYAASRSGALEGSNPFSAGEEPVEWENWREGWECGYYENQISV